jgi:tyrosine-protein kinase Etk/Wzc
MAEYRGFDILDYFVLIVKWKKFFIIQSILIAVISYLLIYFLLPPQFDASATLIAVDEQNLNPVASISKSFRNMPFASLGLGSNSKDEKYDLFNTIILSRTNLEKMIEKFDLKKDYGSESTEKTVKALKSNIILDITPESAYEIKIRSSSPKKAVEMTNFVLNEVNESVIELNVRKARENKDFLEERYREISQNLKSAEDSLMLYQENSGMLEAESQVKLTIEAFSKLEADIARKEIELALTERIYGNNSPRSSYAKIAVEEFRNELNQMMKDGKAGGTILPFKMLPNKALQYYRHFRSVEIYNAMLEFILPLYEQARFEEVKFIPVIQIIDYPTLPEKKSYPPRMVFALLITLFITFSTSIFLLLRENVANTQNPKLKFIKEELFNFKKKR